MVEGGCHIGEQPAVLLSQGVVPTGLLHVIHVILLVFLDLRKRFVIGLEEEFPGYQCRFKSDAHHILTPSARFISESEKILVGALLAESPVRG